MKNKRGNAYAALMVIVIIVIMFMGYWSIMGGYAKIYSIFQDDSTYNARYLTEEDCKNHGYWDGTQCDQLPERAKDLLGKERRVWLIAPFIVVFGLLMWYWSVTNKKDYQQFGGGL